MTASEVRRHLCNMALVCRYFSSIALPRIFAELNIPNGCGDTSINRFCRALANNKEPAASLARYIKTCNFAASMPCEGSLRTQEAFFFMYCVALSKMTSVEAINLDRVTVDDRIIKAVKKLPLLRSLRFSRCIMPDSGVDIFEPFIHSLRLEALVLFRNIGEPFRSAFTPHIFNFRHLKSLEVDDWSIIQHLAKHEDVLAIQSLTIHFLSDSRILPDLFSRTPELSQLHIYRMELVEPITFSSSILPKLSFFDGPPVLARSLVQMRPIKKIWLLGSLSKSVDRFPSSLPLLGHDFWTVLGRSTAPVQEIIMPRHLYDTGSLHKYLPNVSILRVCWCLGNWLYEMVNSKEDLVSVSGNRRHVI